jgi:hypothetical protein
LTQWHVLYPHKWSHRKMYVMHSYVGLQLSLSPHIQHITWKYPECYTMSKPKYDWHGITQESKLRNQKTNLNTNHAKKTCIFKKNLNYKNKTYALESQIIKNDLNHKNCDYIPFTKYLKPHSHLNQFEINTQITKLTQIIPKFNGTYTNN